MSYVVSVALQIVEGKTKVMMSAVLALPYMRNVGLGASVLAAYGSTSGASHIRAHETTRRGADFRA